MKSKSNYLSLLAMRALMGLCAREVEDLKKPHAFTDSTFVRLIQTFISSRNENDVLLQVLGLVFS